MRKSSGWRCWLLKIHNPKVDSFWAKDKSPSFLWPRVPLSQHLLFQQKGLPVCMWMCVYLHSHITFFQCVQLSVVVFIWRRKSVAGSSLGPFTPDPWPHDTAVLSLKQKGCFTLKYVRLHVQLCDRFTASGHTYWMKKNARLKCRRAHLAFCIWTITYPTAELRRRRGRSSFLLFHCVSERKAEIRNAMMWYCGRIKVWVRSGALASKRNQL